MYLFRFPPILYLAVIFSNCTRNPELKVNYVSYAGPNLLSVQTTPTRADTSTRDRKLYNPFMAGMYCASRCPPPVCNKNTYRADYILCTDPTYKNFYKVGKDFHSRFSTRNSAIAAFDCEMGLRELTQRKLSWPPAKVVCRRE